MSRAWTLLRAAHAMPCLAVTAFAVVLGVVAGNGAGACVLIAVAVFTGQLVIGWANDRIDAADDRRSGRTDKPLATGELTTRIVDVALAGALVVTVATSLALGWRAGIAQLVVVAAGVVYDLGLKRNWLSWLPYAVAFGTLPAVATLALDDPRLPGAWALAAGALLGVSAHLTNALPDLDDDRATGALNLPTRIGARPALATATALLAAATLVVAFAPAGTPRWWSWAGLAVTGVLIALAGRPLLRRIDTRDAFRFVVAFVPVVLVMVVLSDTRLR